MQGVMLEYNVNGHGVLLSPIQFRIIKTLEEHPNGLIRGQNYERGSLMKRLNKARTTIYDNLVKLQKLGIVVKYSKNPGTRGRPLKFWKLKSPDNFGLIKGKGEGDA